METASTVYIKHEAGFDAYYSVQWNGGETARSNLMGLGMTIQGQPCGAQFDLNANGPPAGTECWVRVYVQAGPNHDSGRNFIYQSGGGTVTYTCTGATVNPSFD